MTPPPPCPEGQRCYDGTHVPAEAPDAYSPPLTFAGWLADNKVYVLGGVAVLVGVYWLLNRPAPRRASVAGLGRLPHHKSKRRAIARRVKG